jgi:hypothetical protein
MKWEPQPKGITKTLQEPGVAEHLKRQAQAGVVRAQASAPVLTGEYRSSIIVTDARIEGEDLIVSFGSTDEKWHWMEFGSVNNFPHRVLTKAVQEVADRIIT